MFSIIKYNLYNLFMKHCGMLRVAYYLWWALIISWCRIGDNQLCVVHADVSSMLMCRPCWCVVYADVSSMLMCRLCWCVVHAVVWSILTYLTYRCSSGSDGQSRRAEAGHSSPLPVSSIYTDLSSILMNARNIPCGLLHNYWYICHSWYIVDNVMPREGDNCERAMWC